MSWPVELKSVYDKVLQQGMEPLPLFHSTAKAQIELTLSEDGTFQGAVILPEEEAITLIPVTEDSAVRGSDISPMPFADKLIYIAGDYGKYSSVDNQKQHTAYMEQLEDWRRISPHPATDTLYAYLSKNCLMKDLVQAGILKLGTDGKLCKTSISKTAQSEAFVRFVIAYDDNTKEKQTWNDKTLHNSFCTYMLTKIEGKEEQLCYATGEMAVPTYKNPVKIRNANDKARLISANDESGFAYRGRFDTKMDVFSIGQIFSQKMHNGLKWLVSTQRSNFETMTVLTWASELQEIPLIFRPYNKIDEGYGPFETLAEYETWLEQYFKDIRETMGPETKIMVLVLDSALENKGRVSISYYDEIPANEYLDNLYTWYRYVVGSRFDANAKKMVVKSLTPYDVIYGAYGTERTKGLECDKGIVREHLVKLLPSITRGREFPDYLLDRLLRSASNIDAYKKYSHKNIMDALLGVMRLKKKGEIAMGYDPQETNRSYLYGCLLALADKAELDVYPMKERSKVVSNARRYWTVFSREPYSTWQIIEERLRSYLNRHPYRFWVEKQMRELMAKMSPADFADNSPLDAMYLLGYHHFTDHLYNWYKNNTDENNEEDFTDEYAEF